MSEQKYTMYVSVTNQQVLIDPHASPWEYKVEVSKKHTLFLNDYLPKWTAWSSATFCALICHIYLTTMTATTTISIGG